MQTLHCQQIWITSERQIKHCYYGQQHKQCVGIDMNDKQLLKLKNNSKYITHSQMDYAKAWIDFMVILGAFPPGSCDFATMLKYRSQV